MATLIYTLCALTSLLCAGLLLRGYVVTRHHLLMWSGMCFVFLTISNVLLVLDKAVFQDVDLSMWRQLPAFIGMMLLVFGLIWDQE